MVVGTSNPNFEIMSLNGAHSSFFFLNKLNNLKKSGDIWQGLTFKNVKQNYSRTNPGLK